MKQYHIYLSGKLIGIIIFLFFPGTYTHGQVQQLPDTVQQLKYELDSVVEQADTTEGDSYVEEPGDETVQKEYFLRKEFIGGWPDSLQFRRLRGHVIKALQEDEAFWYANETFTKKKKGNNGNFSSHPVFQTILWLIIIGGFVTILILYLYNSNAGLFRKSRNITDDEADMETSDIFAINYEKEIDKAVGVNNYRLAVRLMFLRLLRNLSDRNIIQYKQDSTNFDYMMQLHSTKMYPHFFRITRNYEYSWYGQFDIDKEKYTVIKSDFENFEATIH